MEKLEDPNIKEVSKLLEEMRGMKEILDKDIELLEEQNPDMLIKMLNIWVSNIKSKPYSKSEINKEVSDLIQRFKKKYFDVTYDKRNSCYVIHYIVINS